MGKPTNEIVGFLTEKISNKETGVGDTAGHGDTKGKQQIEDSCKATHYNGSSQGADGKIPERNQYELGCGFIS